MYGIDREEWGRVFDGRLGDGGDAIVRRGRALIELGRGRGRPLTLEILRDAAKRVRPFDGVLDMPDRLRDVTREIVPQITDEFVILSSGYVEVIAATEVAARFDHVFASGFLSTPGDALGHAIRACASRVALRKLREGE